MDKRSVLITGALGGVGQELARTFILAGIGELDVVYKEFQDCTIVLTDLASKEPAAQEFIAALRKEAPSYKGDIVFEALDVTNPQMVKDVLGRITAAYGVDVLVNNAGIMPRKWIRPLAAFKETEEGDDLELALAKMADVNVNGAIRMIRGVLPNMQAKGFGRIINILSTAAIDPEENNLAYGMAKTALAAATRSLAQEVTFVRGMPLGDSGVRINGVAPWIMETEMTEYLRTDLKAIPWMTEQLRRAPIHRAISPRETTLTVVWLASKGASGIHGEIIKVDGGWCDSHKV